MEQRTVEITVVNRKGLGSHVETVDFFDMASLFQRVEEIVDEVPFYKVVVELAPSWDVNDEEQKILAGIESGDEKIEAALRQEIDERNSVEVSGGVIEIDPEDGSIRYIDDHGNTEGVWRPGDDDYQGWKEQYFPNHKIKEEIE